MRFFIAITGLLAFIVSARLYGPEGRGLIAYGTSIISIFALILSFNLGRSFFIETSKDGMLKEKLINEYIGLNFLLLAVTVIAIFIYWFLSPSLRSTFTAQQLVIFSMIAPYYLWSVNGTVIFAVMNFTYKQEIVILITRILLVIFLIVVAIKRSFQIESFIFGYGLILGGGAIVEMLLLGNPLKGISSGLGFSRFINHLKNSKWPHLDYLSFNTFPLFLIIIGTIHLGLLEVGRLNFAIQLVSFVFLLSVVASIRVKSYVASHNSSFYLERIKIIFFATLLSSLIFSFIIFFALRSRLYNEYFSAFGDMHTLFLLLILSLPGYMAYQFLYPISMKNNHIELSAKFNLSIFCLFLIIALIAVPIWQSVALCLIYVGFHVAAMCIQIYINKSTHY